MAETFDAYVRTQTGKNNNRRLRKVGEVPAVVYGIGNDAVTIAMHPKKLQLHLRDTKSMNQVLTLNIDNDGKKTEKAVLIKDVQRDHLRGGWLHVDFLEVKMDEKVEISVPLEFVGKPKGVVEGGLVDVIRREIRLSCLPTAIPSNIQVDISHLGLGEALHISDITVGEGVEFLDGDKLTLVTVNAPAAEKEAVSETVDVAEGEAVAGDETSAPESTKEEVK